MRLSLEYIAGFLDCDGTIVIVRSNRGTEGIRYYPKVCLYSQNLSVIEDLKETVGGKITPLHRSSLVHVLQFCPSETNLLLDKIQPFLRIKREQALLAIELQKHIDGTRQLRKRDGKGGAIRLHASVSAEREQLYLKMRALNHKDSQAFMTNRVNSVKTPKGATPSQAVAANDSTEGVTTREMSANNNSLHEDPARKGRHSLDSTVLPTVQ